MQSKNVRKRSRCDTLSTFCSKMNSGALAASGSGAAFFHILWRLCAETLRRFPLVGPRRLIDFQQQLRITGPFEHVDLGRGAGADSLNKIGY
jgi:hypothetical protein